MKLKSLVIISIFIIILSIGIVSASKNITENNSTLNNPQTVHINGNSFNDIQKSIDNTKKDDIIELEGYFSSSRKPIIIKNDLTIQGSSKNTTLDGKKLSSIFQIKSNVILKNLIIKNSGESAIDFTPENYKKLTIINCTFQNNDGGEYGDGGCIFCNMGSFTIINSTFTNNNANYGGAIYSFSFNEQNKCEIINCNFKNHENNVIYSNNKFNITNSTFENNGVNDWSGGAIFTFADLNITNSNFINNTGLDGGAIYLYQCNLTLNNCFFNKNTAVENGGSIYSYGILLSNDKINANVIIINSNFINSKSGKDGAIIATVFTNLTINNTEIHDSLGDNSIYIKAGIMNISNESYIIKKIDKIKAKLQAKNFKTEYNSQKRFYVKLTDMEQGYDVSERTIKLKVFTGKRAKEYIIITYDDDICTAELYITKEFSIGKHKVEITSLSKYYDSKKITVYITVNKAKLTVKAPVLKTKYKKSKKFTVNIKNKNNIKLKIKVFTGKKSKTFKVRTNKKGIASINTKHLKLGHHKVKITSLNKNYILSKESEIIII